MRSFEYLRFEDPQHSGQFTSSVQRSKFADEVDEENPLKGALMSLSRTQSILVSGPTRNIPHIEGSELMKVRLPPTFVRRIDIYSKLTKTTRSALLTRFFDRGLLLYIRSQIALMRAMREAMQSKEDRSSTGTVEHDAVKPI